MVLLLSKAASVLGHKGICYIYGNNNFINYPEMDEKIEKKMYKPEEGNIVLEWESIKYCYRLFGTVSYDDLILIAEGIVGV